MNHKTDDIVPSVQSKDVIWQFEAASITSGSETTETVESQRKTTRPLKCHLSRRSSKTGNHHSPSSRLFEEKNDPHSKADSEDEIKFMHKWGPQRRRKNDSKLVETRWVTAMRRVKSKVIKICPLYAPSTKIFGKNSASGCTDSPVNCPDMTKKSKNRRKLGKYLQVYTKLQIFDSSVPIYIIILYWALKLASVLNEIHKWSSLMTSASFHETPRSCRNEHTHRTLIEIA